jgi:nucleoid-associated protein YgaU
VADDDRTVTRDNQEILQTEILAPIPVAQTPAPAPLYELTNIQSVTLSQPEETIQQKIPGLEPIVATALAQGMNGAEIDILIAQAVQSGLIKVPPQMLNINGDVDTRAILTTLVQTPAPKIVRPLGNTYIVRPGDTLALIAQRYYGTRDAVEDIYWANKDRLANPDALSVGQTLFLPQL